MTELTFAVDEATIASLLAAARRPSRDEAEALIEHIRPVVRRDGELYYVEKPEVDVVFTEIPQFTARAEGLKVVGQSHTVHTFNAQHSTLRPTCIEVFSFLPDDLREQVVAFEVVGPTTQEEWSGQWAAHEADRHVGITTWYARA